MAGWARCRLPLLARAEPYAAGRLRKAQALLNAKARPLCNQHILFELQKMTISDSSAKTNEFRSFAGGPLGWSTSYCRR